VLKDLDEPRPEGGAGARGVSWIRVPFAAWLRRFRARLWTSRGRRRLERGDLAGAVWALQTALRLRPGSFAALLLLSRAYLRNRDPFRARSALAQARETDRRRFEASAGHLVALEGYDLSALCPAPGAVAATVAAVETATATRRVRTPLPLGDCRDLDEYARFRAMPPVARGEIDDWDEVIGDLLDE
jgi:hypothetical protein